MLLNDLDTQRRDAARCLLAWLSAEVPCRLVATALGDEPVPVQAPAHGAWSAAHTHRLPYREALLALQGNAAFGWRGALWECSPGTAFLLEAGEGHDLGYPPWADGLLHVWLSLAPGHAAGNLIAVQGGRVLGLARLHADPSEAPGGPDLDRLWSLARTDTAFPTAVHRALVLAALRLMLADLARHLQAGSAPRRGPAEARRLAVQTACRLIRQAEGQAVPLDALARAAGYSKYHFLRLFTQETGMTVRQYADRCRLEAIAGWRGEGLRHKEIAARMGFSGSSALSRWWRRQSARAGGTADAEPSA